MLLWFMLRCSSLGWDGAGSAESELVKALVEGVPVAVAAVDHLYTVVVPHVAQEHGCVLVVEFPDPLHVVDVGRMGEVVQRVDLSRSHQVPDRSPGGNHGAWRQLHVEQRERAGGCEVAGVASRIALDHFLDGLRVTDCTLRHEHDVSLSAFSRYCCDHHELLASRFLGWGAADELTFRGVGQEGIAITATHDLGDTIRLELLDDLQICGIVERCLVDQFCVDEVHVRRIEHRSVCHL